MLKILSSNHKLDSPSSLNNSHKNEKIALTDSNVKQSFNLVSKEILTHDTRRFRFALPSNEHTFGLPVGNHVNVSAKIHGDLVVRYLLSI